MTRGDPDHLSIVIHEIRNPLVGIDAAARVLAGELGSHPAAKRATAIAAEARQLLGLLDGVAEAEAAASGRLRSVLAPMDLGECVHETVAATHLGGHTVSVSGADAPVMVRADEGRIRQVLRNLLANAARYSAPASPIEVTVAVDPRGRTATVDVRDHGPGIPMAERRRLFTKFARLSTAATTRGSGLGLYISSAIVADHGGTIRYDRPTGGGSVFSFALPLEGRMARKKERDPAPRSRGAGSRTRRPDGRASGIVGGRRGRDPRPEATSALGRAAKKR